MLPAFIAKKTYCPIINNHAQTIMDIITQACFKKTSK